jgi:hypothetical protein
MSWNVSANDHADRRDRLKVKVVGQRGNFVPPWATSPVVVSLAALFNGSFSLIRPAATFSQHDRLPIELRAQKKIAGGVCNFPPPERYAT